MSLHIFKRTVLKSTEEAKEWKKTVLKQGLKERMEDALKGGRVLMFSAPCGFGKTTAVRSLLSGRHSHMIQADGQEFFLPPPSGRWQTLIIDDLQYVADEGDQQDLCSLIRENPERYFIFLSRGEIPGWLIPFQTTGVMTVFRERDLALDRESVSRLFSEYGIGVSDVVLTSVLEDTKGYPLALSILADHMKKGEPYNEVTKDQVRREIFLYYEEMVYRRFSLSDRRMLLDLAPFEQFDSELVRIISGNSRAGKVLDRLQRDTTMFVRERMNSYSFRPLFRDFLLWKMEQEYSEEQKRDLYNRGGLYYELKEDYGNALACYSKIGAYTKISELPGEKCGDTSGYGTL